MEKAYPDLQSTRRIRGDAVDEYQRKLAGLKERIRSGSGQIQAASLSTVS